MTELLAPAGSLEALRQAVDAGADAVYIGGQMFGARAYADNPDETELIEGIEYCHLRGRKIYLTVNTLLKERELKEQLIPWLAPFYYHGLDAVIVQDLGVLRVMRETFPGLELHASTQMSVTTSGGALWLKRHGISRVVPARELSLSEVQSIVHTGVEVETFIHGAMCYCYSGRCLFSSLLGGRSGNRGRCAQPCRLPYDCAKAPDKDSRKQLSESKSSLLGMKDMSTLDILPDLMDSGISSFKIEGRMKSPQYTAGVTSVYRKYMDLYRQEGRNGYRIKEKDRRALTELFDRGGYSSGYYQMKNGPSMIMENPAADKSAAAVRQRNERNQLFLQEKSTVKINGDLRIYPNEPVILSLWTAGAADHEGFQVEVRGDVPETARTNAATTDDVSRQMRKTGGTPFEFVQLRIDLADGLFLPVRMLNELRRNALDQLKEKILCERGSLRQRMELNADKDAAADVFTDAKAYESCVLAESANITSHRKDALSDAEKVISHRKDALTDTEKVSSCRKSTVPSLNILVTTMEQLDEVFRWLKGIAKAGLPDIVDTIYLDSFLLGKRGQPASSSCARLKIQMDTARRFGTRCMFCMPPILREAGYAVLEDPAVSDLLGCMDGFLVQTMDELAWLKGHAFSGTVVSDSCLYTFNQSAREELRKDGISRFTYPAELNARELMSLGGGRCSELVIYGREPLMQSAQCLRKNTTACKEGGLLYLRDRKNIVFPVLTRCLFCTNTIYNSVPLHLAGCFEDIKKISPSSVRVSFTVETREETRHVLSIYEDLFGRVLSGKDLSSLRNADLRTTKGHFKRGVE
ncbi:MAG: U32 family peptidase [Lachnospiraceae bacterium]|nr:U32 family peptidase [Lachnospiraceae bacterium]